MWKNCKKLQFIISRVLSNDTISFQTQFFVFIFTLTLLFTILGVTCVNWKMCKGVLSVNNGVSDLRHVSKLYDAASSLWRSGFVREKWKHPVLSDEGPTLETLDFAFYIGSTPTFLYFDLYVNSAYATPTRFPPHDCHLGVCDLLRNVLGVLQHFPTLVSQRIMIKNCAAYTQSHTPEWHS